MTDLKPSCPSDSEVLAAFHHELARAGQTPCLLGAGPALWPRFAAYYRSLARLPRRMRRSLQGRWRRSLGGLALLCALGQAPTFAATIEVDGTSCTLVDAITAANNDGPVGGCTAGSGADTIVLPANSIHTLTAVNNTADSSPNGLPPIVSTITIAGNGSTITRDPAAPDFRILLVNNGGNLTLGETTVSGGRTIQFHDGGGVANSGVLSLVNSNVVNNYSPRGGGGLHNNFSATLRLTNSAVSGNLAGFYGGGIFNRNILTLTNSTVSGNSATQDGGGVISRDTLTLLNSTVSANTASQFGGGLRISSGSTATLTNSTVSGNLARANGGGLNNTGTFTLTNSTVSGNSAGGNGGGVYSGGGTLTLNQTLISGNTASSLVPSYTAKVASSTATGSTSSDTTAARA